MSCHAALRSAPTTFYQGHHSSHHPLPHLPTATIHLLIHLLPIGHGLPQEEAVVVLPSPPLPRPLALQVNDTSNTHWEKPR